MTSQLTTIDGPAPGTRFLLVDDHLPVGSAPDSAIVLEAAAVAPHHAVFKRVGEDYVIHDLNSAAGTYVNERRIAEQVLRHGDEVRVGEQVLRYEFVRRRESTPLDPVLPREAPAQARGAGIVWLATLVLGTIAVGVALGLFGLAILLIELRWSRALPPAASTGLSEREAPLTTMAYRDPSGRFVCQVPSGWQVARQPSTVRGRSEVRLVGEEDDEIRVIAQEADGGALVAEDLAAAQELFGQALQQARAAGVEGRLERVAWKTIGDQRVLVIELEMGLPEYLWMRQIKWRIHGVDHTVALYVGDPQRRAAAITPVFETFLERYRSLPSVAVATLEEVVPAP